MKILARGSKARVEELKLRLSSVEHDLKWVEDSDLLSANVENYDLIFDLKFDDRPEQLKYYTRLSGTPIIVGAVKQQLAKAVYDYGRKINVRLIGMNTLPTFINRNLAEIALLEEEDAAFVDGLMQKLGWQYRLVRDRVGMVTPRVVFMIINEACYTLQEGTASMKDIDTSMKLGTNYPYGPFEWADKVGIKHVYETLLAIYEDTKDERYKICPLLKRKFLKGESFY